MNDQSESFDEDIEWFREQRPEILLLHPIRQEWVEEDFADMVAMYMASGKMKEDEARLRALKRYDREKKREGTTVL